MKLETAGVTAMNRYETSYSGKEERKHRGKSPVIKNGFSGNIFLKKTSKKEETTSEKEIIHKENGIASEYFQSVYGGTVKDGRKDMTPRGRKGSVTSDANTPDREKSERSTDSPNRYSSFSYLNLLPSDGSFPHRTQPIGDATTSRRNSETGKVVEFSNVTTKNNFMIRSNPIGLAEPSIKRDGCSVGRDGSLYRSSENLLHFTSNVLHKNRSSSLSVEYQTKSSSWKERRASWGTVASPGIGLGRGLIETGKPAKNTFMPFGSTKGAIKSYIQRHICKYKKTNDKNDLTTENKNSSTEKSSAEKFDIEKGIQEIKSLTQSHGSCSSTLEEKSTQERQSRKSIFEEKKLRQDNSMNLTAVSSKESSKSANLGIAFREIDIALKAIPSKEEEITQVTLPRSRRRAQSLTKMVNMELPEENVTISLPASRRASRQPSMERKTLRKDSSVEIFKGSYDLIGGRNAKGSFRVKEVSQEIIVFKENCQINEAASASLILDTKEIDIAHNRAINNTNEKNKETKSSTNNCTENIVKHSEALLDVCNDISSYEQFNAQESINDCAPPINTKTVCTIEGLNYALEALSKKCNNDEANLANKLKDEHLAHNDKINEPASKLSSRCSSSGRSFNDEKVCQQISIDTKRPVNIAEKIGKCTESEKKANKNGFMNENLTCRRCYNPQHSTENCTTFNSLKCPRCLEWDHWEDSCPSVEHKICNICRNEGHTEKIHSVEEFNQRKCIVDILGWEPFQEWFYGHDFRTFWQLNGYLGVPLYKIYKRNTEWRLEPEYDPEEYDYKYSRILSEDSIKSKGGYALTRDDSIDELMKSVYAPRKRIEIPADDDSGRSTPEYLKKYPGSSPAADLSDTETSVENPIVKRRRTFSETLKLLDDDILAELDIK